MLNTIGTFKNNRILTLTAKENYFVVRYSYQVKDYTSSLAFHTYEEAIEYYRYVKKLISYGE